MLDFDHADIASTGGIRVYNVRNFSLSGNVVKNTGTATTPRPGIYIDRALYGSVVGNTCADDVGTTMSYGIWQDSAGTTPANSNVIVGNVSRGHVTAALSFESNQRLSIAGMNVGDWYKKSGSATILNGQ